MPTQEVAPEPLVRIERLCKSFGTLMANQDISFDIRKGEVHCLLGENGAGKSTLSETLYGHYKPDSGAIYFNGERLTLESPKDAVNAGIGMVHQHFILAQPMSVVENIVVGTPIPGIRTNLKQAAEKISNLCKQYELNLDPYTRVSDLSVGQQQWVEILKALYSGVKLLILDEPTAVLTPQESEKLFIILKHMTDDGLAILLITHKLYEVLSISDRVTVLRKGKLIGTVDTSDVDRDELARMMVGRVVKFKVSKEPIPAGKVVLNVDHVSVQRENKVFALNKICLTVHKNEIVGLAGVAGNGQQELFDVIVGVQKVLNGKVELDGTDITDKEPIQVSKQGVASIPPDRIDQGLVMNFSIQENLILGMHRDAKFRHGLVYNRMALEQFSKKSISDYDIAVQTDLQPARTLSGGNLQKVILARELSQNPKFVIASSPTRGLDVGATEYVHSKLVQLRSEGSGILLISEDLDEIFNVADVIAVIYNGEILGVVRTDETTKEDVGLLMAGIVGREERSQ